MYFYFLLQATKFYYKADIPMQQMHVNGDLRLKYILNREDPFGAYVTMPNYTSLSIFLNIKLADMFAMFSVLDIEDKVTFYIEFCFTCNVSRKKVILARSEKS